MARMSKQSPFNPTPDITMGQRPDGSPWCMSVGFGANVYVDPYLRVKVDRKELDVDDAEQQALAMLAAVEWIRAGRTAALEAEKSKEEQ